MQSFVDVAFPLKGRELPIDHGYPLFAAVSRLLPRLHKEPTWGIHPVYGRREEPGRLRLLSNSLLTMRIPTGSIGELLVLSGQTLDVAGAKVAVGIPRVFPLRPRPMLRSRLVTIKKFTEEGTEFYDAVRRQLNAMEVSDSVTITVGARRVVRVSTHIIIGFPVELRGLTEDESVRVQTVGIGGRRHMGAGLFLTPEPS